MRDELEHLFRNHAEQGRRLAMVMVGHADDADDALQAAAAVAVRKAHRATSLDWPWLAGVIVNECRNLRRIRARRRRREERAAMQRKTVEPSPAENAERAELIARTRRALETLPKIERKVIAMVFGAGMTQREAANALGVAPSTVANRTDSALARMRRQVAGAEVRTGVATLAGLAPATGWRELKAPAVAAGAGLGMAAWVALTAVLVIAAAAVALVAAGWFEADAGREVSERAHAPSKGGAREGREAETRSSTNDEPAPPDPTNTAGITPDNDAGARLRPRAATPDGDASDNEDEQPVSPTNEPDEDADNTRPTSNGEHLRIRTFGRDPTVWYSGVYTLALAVSPDGGVVATNGPEGTVVLRRASDGVEIRRLRAGAGTVRALDFSDDGTRLLSGSTDGSCVIWDYRTGSEITRIKIDEQARPACLAGDAIVSGNETLRRWNVSGEVLATYGRRRTEQLHVHALPGGQHVISATYQHGVPSVVAMWDVETGKQVRRFDMPKGQNWFNVRATAVNHDGSLLAVGGYADEVHVLRIDTGAPVHSFSPGRYGGSASLAFTSGGRRLITAGIDKTLRVWSLSTGALERSIDTGQGGILKIAVGPNPELVFCGDQTGRIFVWNVATGEVVSRPDDDQTHSDRVSAAVYTPDGASVISMGDDGELRRWNVLSGDAEYSVKLPISSRHDRPATLHIARNGSVVGVAFGDQRPQSPLLIVDAGNGEIVRSIEFPGERVSPFGGIDVSPDGRVAAVAIEPYEFIRLIPIRGGEPTAIPIDVGQWQPWVRFNAAGDMLCVRGSQVTKVYRVADGTEVCRREARATYTCFDISADGSTIVQVEKADGGSIAALLDVGTGHEMARFEADNIEPGHRHGVALSPSGNRLLLFGGSAVRIIDTQTGKVLERFYPHAPRATIGTMTISPDGTTFLTTGIQPGEIKLWRMP